jgi:hypothetical protein
MIFQVLVACAFVFFKMNSQFGGCRKTVQKGLIEQEYQVDLLPHFARRGRRTCEAQSPTLARMSTELLDEQQGRSGARGIETGSHGACHRFVTRTSVARPPFPISKNLRERDSSSRPCTGKSD